ncbi:MAG: (2Fe-2S)-binding protein [Spirochaetes bacterium]|nr:(2Fe-2S)-binding protein [Spirochaetota bacterium]
MEKVTITINGHECQGMHDQSVLAVAREHGIYIPALCHHPEMPSSGGFCRVCLVEAHQDGRMRLVTACNYPVRKGLEIKTDTELVKRIRRGIMELLLCRVPESPVIREMAARDGVTKTRFFRDEGEGLRQRCIACGLCTQVCEEVVGVAALAMLNRGRDKEPGTPYHKSSSVCIGCGACAYICPTGAIAMVDRDDTRTIWGRSFAMVKCSVCGAPYIPEAQVEWIVKTTGKDRSFFDKCPNHR